MIDLPASPASSASSASTTTTRSAAKSSARGAPARDTGAQEDDSPFQALLAQELGLPLGGRTLPGNGLPSVAAKADSSRKPDAIAAQIAAAGDAPVSPACAGVLLFAPALAGASVAPPEFAGVSRLAPGYVPAGTGRATAALDPRPNRLASQSAAADAASQSAPAGTSVSPPELAGVSRLAPGYIPAGTGRATAALDPHQNRQAKESAAVDAAAQLPAAPGTADVAAAGKIAPSAEGEIHREVAFDANLLDSHNTAPAASAAMHSGSTGPAQVTHATVAALEARVGEHGWDQGLGDKLVWMAGQKLQVAELHLNPPDLGPLKITLTLEHDQASAQFVSAHAPVREAIEAAMPRLREMLADNGITLGNTSVGADAFHEQAQPQHEPRAFPATPAAAAMDAVAVARGERPLRSSLGLVDTFA